MTDERACLESPILPIVIAIALLVEYQPNGGTVNIFPLTGEDMAISGPTRRRWENGIRGSRSIHRRHGARCSEHHTDEKERNISLTPRKDDRPYTVRHSRMTDHGYSPLLEL
jgi:hypothetical protein